MIGTSALGASATAAPAGARPADGTAAGREARAEPGTRDRRKRYPSSPRFSPTSTGLNPATATHRLVGFSLSVIPRFVSGSVLTAK
jgi:hypothetical protein